MADHEADRNVDEALMELQTQNKGLRQALGLPVDAVADLERDLIFATGEDVGANSKGRTDAAGSPD